MSFRRVLRGCGPGNEEKSYATGISAMQAYKFSRHASLISRPDSLEMTLFVSFNWSKVNLLIFHQPINNLFNLQLFIVGAFRRFVK